MRLELIKARKGANLTQQQLADRIGVDRSYIAHIERGKKTPSLPIATRIAVELNTTVEQLFSSGNVAKRHDSILFKTGTG